MAQGMDLFASPFAVPMQTMEPSSPFAYRPQANPMQYGQSVAMQFRRRQVADQLVEMGLTPNDDEFFTTGATLLAQQGDMAGANLLASQGRSLAAAALKQQQDTQKLGIEDVKARASLMSAEANLLSAQGTDEQATVMTLNQFRESQGEPSIAGGENMFVEVKTRPDGTIESADLQFPPKGTNFSVDMGAKIPQVVADNISAAQKELKDVRSTLRMTEMALSYLPDAVVGPGQEIKKLSKRFLTSFGVADAEAEKALASSAALDTALKNLVLGKLQSGALGSGSGISDADRKFLESAVGADGNLTKPELEAIMYIMLDMEVSKWQETQDFYRRSVSGIAPDMVNALSGFGSNPFGDDPAAEAKVQAIRDRANQIRSGAAYQRRAGLIDEEPAGSEPIDVGSGATVRIVG